MSNINFSVIGSLLGIHVQTSMHAGAGSALGVVDLPIQRERHTHWPVVAGSAIKGILRDACRECAKNDEGYERSRKKANENHPQLVAAFGPANPDEDSAHAGALAITDARILAFPVRSLRGVFAWVTCPAVLERLKRDCQLAKVKAPAMEIPKIDNDNQAIMASPSSPLLMEDKKHLVLEEFEFQTDSSVAKAAELAKWIGENIVGDEGAKGRVASHLVILHDDQFTHFVRHATEVVARIGLDYEKKTVKTGALFYQEFLPPETLLYSVVLANPSRQKPKDGNGANFTSDSILSFLEKCLPSHLQIGGDETIGKGICQVKLSKGGNN